MSSVVNEDTILDYLGQAWPEKFKAAERAREPFDNTAALAGALYASPDYKNLPGLDPTQTMGLAFKDMSYNITAHFVTTFGPMLYHEDPVRTMTTRHRFALPNSPTAQEQEFVDEVVISLLSQLLNYTPREQGLKRESARGILQALITGRGCLWTEMDRWTGMPGSYYDNVKNLFIDPDATNIENARWIARRRVLPIWYVRQRFGLSELEIQAHMPSADGNADGRADGELARRQLDHTSDTVTIYEVFSKMGWGARLSGANPDLAPFEAMAGQLAGIGDNVYLVFAVQAGINRPLNVHPDMTSEEMAAATRWPIEFWQDNAWPVSVLDFFEVPNKAWPMAPIQQVRGQVLFLNWAYGHLAGKVKTTCRDFIALSKTLDPEIENQITSAIELAILHIPHDQMTQAGGIDNLVGFLQHPEFKRDIYTVLQMIEDDVKAKLGLTELVTGQVSQQMRTTTEATARTEYSRVKPDAMADAVEEWQSEAARKEALAARTMLRATQQGMQGMQLTSFGQFLGPEAAGMWDRLVATDMAQAVKEYEYRIEAGSARKPNKYREVDNAHLFAQQFGATAASLLMAGDPSMHNSIVEMMTRAMNFDPGPMLLSNEQAQMLQQMGLQAAGPPGGQTPNQPGQALPGGSPAGMPPPTRPEQPSFQMRTA